MRTANTDPLYPYKTLKYCRYIYPSLFHIVAPRTPRSKVKETSHPPSAQFTVLHAVPHSLFPSHLIILTQNRTFRYLAIATFAIFSPSLSFWVPFFPSLIQFTGSSARAVISSTRFIPACPLFSSFSVFFSR